MKKQVVLMSLWVGISFFTPTKVLAQYPCPNINFSYGTLAHWQCYMGGCSGTSYWVSPTSQIPGKIDIMNRTNLEQLGQLYDPYCSSIPKVPDGYQYSCRVGNSAVNSEVDGIEYTMRVDSSNSLLMLGFAWVMQNCGTTNAQPQFNMKIKDSAGNLITSLPCNPVNFISDPTAANLACRSTSGTVNAMDWVFTGYSLDSLMGQTVKIYLETRDCTTGGHFGYAYVMAECRPIRIELMYCAGSPAARMIAPEGFTLYEWTRSSDTSWRRYTRQINVPNPSEGEIFTVTVTNILGCKTQLKVVIVKTSVNADFMFGVKDANGHVDFAAHGNKSWYDTCSRTVTFVDLSTVTNSKKDRIMWSIHGLNAKSADSMWTYTFPDPAVPTTYRVRLQVEAQNGCADTSNPIDHYITIYPSAKVKIDGPTELCEGHTARLSPIAVRSKFTRHYWSWKKNDGSTGLCTCDTLTITEHSTYYLKSLDTAGCYAYDTLIVTSPKVIIQNLQIRNIMKCWEDTVNIATGQFSHGNIIGGNPPFWVAKWTYWDNNEKTMKDSNIISLIGTIVTFRNQIAGDYHFYGVDNNGCEIRATITIKEPDSLYFIATPKEKTCFDDNGEIAFKVIGGTPPYKISVENTNTHEIKTPTNKTKDTIFNLSAGTYIAKVEDNIGCKAFDDTVIVTAAPITPLASISLSEKDMNIPYLNQTKKLNVTLTPTDICDSNVVWQSRDADIASVNMYGLVKGISYGETYIVVTSVGWGMQDSCKVTVGSTGITNYELRNTNYVIYPNPTNGQLKIKNYELRDAVDYSIYSVIGQIVLQGKLQDKISIINVGYLANGMYFLRIADKTLKFVKE